MKKQTRPIHKFQAQEEMYNGMCEAEAQAQRTAHLLAMAVEQMQKSYQLLDMYQAQLKEAGCQTRH